MPLGFFLKGLLIGFSIAAPVGPIGVLCIRRTLVHGRLIGFISGLGAATADAFYGAVAAFGLTAISSFLVGWQKTLALLGGLFLLYLGIKFLLSKPKELKESVNDVASLLPAYTSTVFLTVTNPTTILSFVAVFAGLGLGSLSTNTTLSATAMVLGVFLGSCAWWLLLSEIVHFMRQRLSVQSLGWANKLAGCVILIFGIVAVAKGLL